MSRWSGFSCLPNWRRGALFADVTSFRDSTMKTRSFCLAIGLLWAVGSWAAEASFKVSEFSFTPPTGWESVPVASQMRKAQLKVVDSKTKEAADVIFFHFGQGDGGGTKANVERWLSQFQEPRDKINAKSEEVTVGKHKVTYVQAEGTYMSGMPGAASTPMADYGLLGAIIESDQGNVFIRMTGPKKLVKASQKDFKKMVEGAVKGG